MSNQEKCNDALTQICVSGFDSKQEENGYQKLPSGLIMQWGTIKPEDIIGNYDKSQDVLFPIEFPNSCFMVNLDFVERTIMNVTDRVWIIPNSQTKRGFTFSHTFQSPEFRKPVLYFAIGN